jgi:hypothetical protein
MSDNQSTKSKAEQQPNSQALDEETECLRKLTNADELEQLVILGLLCFPFI